MEQPVPAEGPIAALSLKDIIVSTGAEQALGPTRVTILTKDYSHMTGYKDSEGNRKESHGGVLVAGRGEVIQLGNEQNVGFADKTE